MTKPALDWSSIELWGVKIDVSKSAAALHPTVRIIDIVGSLRRDIVGHSGAYRLGKCQGERVAGIGTETQPFADFIFGLKQQPA